MSLCSHTIRAISRSQASKSKTLLPFLYQTATIQQWKPATRPIARRNITSRSKPGDDIPFEDTDGKLPPTLEEAQSARKTTITDTERAAFEKLYKTFNTQGQGRPKGKSGEHEELDQVADEYYEDDEDSSSSSLDKIFDDVLQGSPRMQNAQRNNRNLEYRTSNVEGFSAGKEAQAPVSDTLHNKKKLAAKVEKEKIRKLRMEERERVDKLLKSAQTDRQLWQILEREVFDQLRKLDLDETNSSKKERSKANTPKIKSKSAANSIVDTRVLFPNYPHHLLTAVSTLRTHFPASPLALTILPTIKSLGRSSYALGATPKLYKYLLRTAWIQQSSYAMMDTLLTDMETNIVEFDAEILEVLDAVIKEHDTAKNGQLGREMQMVYGMEMWMEGIKKVKVWRDLVASRLGVQDDVVPERFVRRPERLMREGTRRVQRNEVVGHGGHVPLVEGAQPVEFGDDVAGDAGLFGGKQTSEHTLADTRDDAIHRETSVEVPIEQTPEEKKDSEETLVKVIL
jgi:hypothetical protein